VSIKEKRVADVLNAVSRSNIRSALEDIDLNDLIADYFGGVLVKQFLDRHRKSRRQQLLIRTKKTAKAALSCS
jgi:glycyl-tRNA synthetase beta subunit